MDPEIYPLGPFTNLVVAVKFRQLKCGLQRNYILIRHDLIKKKSSLNLI